MYAVVKTGGKQVRVQPGDVIDIELIDGNPGDKIRLSEVLLVGGDSITVGTPLVAGAVVLASIEGDSSGPKIRTFKYKRRKRYRLTRGHRQHYTRIRIETIEV